MAMTARGIRRNQRPCSTRPPCGRLVRLALAAWLGLLLFALVSRASAQAPPYSVPGQAPFPCPLDPYAYPEKCEKLARRYQLQLERQARDASIQRYREAHPWRVSVLLDSSLFGLGLGSNYVAGSWGLGGGVSTLREIVPSWTLRMDAIGRIGRGHISNWNVDDPGPIKKSTGYMGGFELRASVLKRMRVMYFGPALSLGLLHLRSQTLHEADFPDEFDGFDHFDTATVQVPRNAVFLTAGFVVGGEPIPDGRYGITMHFAPGVWNDLQHMYFTVSVNLTIKLWD